MRWLTIVLAALTLVVVGAGCGGGDDESSASGDTTVAETITEDTTTEDTTTDEDTTDDTDLSGVLADEDCLALAAVGASFAQAFAGASGTSNEDSAALDELADKVPDEIKADVQAVSDAYADYAAELQDIGIEAGQTPSAEQLQQLQAAAASLSQPGVSEANERLSAYAETNCPNG